MEGFSLAPPSPSAGGDAMTDWRDGPEPPDEHRPPCKGESGGVMIVCGDCKGTGKVPCTCCDGGNAEWREAASCDTCLDEDEVICWTCKGAGEVENCEEREDT